MSKAMCHPSKKLVAYGYCLSCFGTWLGKRKPSERYGLSVEDAVELMLLQDAKCYLCELEFGKDMPVIDHSYLTGKPKGFAHRACNSAIAAFNENPRILRMAADNLEHPPFDEFEAKRGTE